MGNGPLAAGLVRFGANDEAVQLVNNTRYGLSASVWTGNARADLTLAR